MLETGNSGGLADYRISYPAFYILFPVSRIPFPASYHDQLYFNHLARV